MFSIGQSMTKGLQLALVGTLFTGASAAHAELLAYEGFDYDNSTTNLAGRNGGTGWDGAWSVANDPNNSLTTDDVSIPAPPSPFTPIGDRIHKTTNNAGTFSTSFRAFAEAGSGLNMGTDGTLYASFSWSKTDGGTGGDNFEFKLHDSNGGQVLRFGSTSSDQLFLNSSTAVAAGDQFGAVSLGTTYFTVLKLTASAAGNDTLEVVNYTTTPGSEPVAWDKSVSINLGSGVDVNRFYLVMGNASRGQFDELRVGTTWDDVAAVAVPEPATLGLLALGGLAAFGRRRGA